MQKVSLMAAVLKRLSRLVFEKGSRSLRVEKYMFLCFYYISLNSYWPTGCDKIWEPPACTLFSDLFNVLLANFKRRLFEWNFNWSTFDPLSANPTKWSNTLKQLVGNLLTDCFSVFDYFVRMALQGLRVRKLSRSKEKQIISSVAFRETFDGMSNKKFENVGTIQSIAKF